MDVTPIETQDVLNDGLRILARIIARDIMINRSIIKPVKASLDENAGERPQEK